MTDIPIDVCIPAYDMNGLGAAYLEDGFRTLENQTLTDFGHRIGPTAIMTY